MTSSIEPVSPEQVNASIQSAVGSEDASAPIDEKSLDLYAESELQLRHERTERMIRRAQELV